MRESHKEVSCLILFLLFINDVVGADTNNSETSLYADDIAVWTWDKDKKKAEQTMQKKVNEIAKWSNDWRLKLSAPKCETAFFSSDTREASWKPSISIEGTPLNHNPHPVLLGVTFDRTLRL